MKYRFLAVALMAVMSVAVVRAEGCFTLGAGVGVSQHPWRDYSADTRLMPAVSWESDTFWFRGLGGGMYLWDDASDTLSIAAWWAPVFKPGDSDDSRLRLLDERKSIMMTGITWSHHTPVGFLRVSFAGDALDNSHGSVGDVAWLYRYVNGGLTLTPGVGGAGAAGSRMITTMVCPVLNHCAARYHHLSDEETGSPMVDKEWDGILSMGITYRF